MPDIFDAELTHTDKLNDYVGIFRFKPEKDVSFKAGQFITLGFKDSEVKKKCPLSIASSPHDDEIEFLVRKHDDGQFTPKLFALQPGEKMQMIGPTGHFFFEPTDGKLTFIGAGCGISPLRSMVRHLAKDGFKNETLIIQSASYLNGLAYKDEFERYAEDEKVTYIPSLSREDPNWKGEMGRAENILKKHIKSTEGMVYICGPPPMIENSIKELKEIGFTDDQIRKEGW